MSFEQDAHEVFEMLEVIAILTCGTVIACVVGLPPLRLAAIGRLLSQGVFFCWFRNYCYLCSAKQ